VYKDEIDFLIANSKRNRFICNLAGTRKGNTLVLYTYVEKHGKILYDLIRDKYPGRKVFFVHGKVEAEEREEVRHITENETDAIIVASYGTFSTGINIRNLHNAIFASPSKSVIRVLQSLGRLLRLGENKTEATLYDISDDLRYKSYTNFTLKHYEERIKIYNNEKFTFKTHNIGLT
jgi:superfamily II DNA or RNA helicase